MQDQSDSDYIFYFMIKPFYEMYWSQIFLHIYSISSYSIDLFPFLIRPKIF